MRFRTLTASALLLMTFMPTRAEAQARPFLPVVLRVPMSTRMLALGDAGVAGRDDDVVFYDPAQVAVARGTSVSGERYSSSTSGGALSTVMRLASGGVALGASWVTYETPTAAYPGSRADFASGSGVGRGTSMLATLAIAQTYKKFHVGVAGKYLADARTAEMSGLVADVGISRDVSAFGTPLTAAIAAQNIGPDFGALPANPNAPQHVPTRYVAGAAGGWPVGLLDLGLAAQVSVMNYGFVAPAGGVELGYSWLDGYSVTGRVGARRPEDGVKPLTAGVGFQWDRLTIDYALETLDRGRAGHRVGLRIR